MIKRELQVNQQKVMTNRAIIKVLRDEMGLRFTAIKRIAFQGNS
jgi:hypothetical protein